MKHTPHGTIARSRLEEAERQKKKKVERKKDF